MAKKEKASKQDYKGKTPDELKAQIAELKKELFNLRFQRAQGEAAPTARFKEARKEIARILTHLRQSQTTGQNAA
jgi:large subunit ribosomal protein L29